MTTAQVVETKSLSTTTVLFTFVNIIALTCPSDRVMTSLYLNVSSFRHKGKQSSTKQTQQRN